MTAEHFDSQLIALYSEQAKHKTNNYLHAHSHNLAVIRRDTSIFKRYSRFVPESGRVLDWGCAHAPTACLVKMLRGDSIELHGCDVHAEEYRAFYEFAGLRYSQLRHHYELPYEDNFFDAVIGTAALEHVANDGESLNQLYRVIKPGGLFIMTTLPNRFSYTEWLNRMLRKPHHLRTYSLSGAKEMFLHHGFLPVVAGYHQVFPSLMAVGSRFANKVADALASKNEAGERIWPIRCFASNVFLIGKKVAGIDNADFDVHKRI